MLGGKEVLYEDAWMILANKPEGIPVHETKDPNRTDFTRQIQSRFNYPHLRTVNRLDLGTSGIVILGKDPSKNVEIDLLAKSSEKKYLFIAEGIPTWSETTFSCFLKDGNKKVTVVRSGGKKAITVFRVIEINKQSNLFLGEATLVTGRRHQIRISLSTLGHPILGDPLYGSNPSPNTRMFLHSYSIHFQNLSGENVTVSCLPSESFFTIFLVSRQIFSNLSLWH